MHGRIDHIAGGLALFLGGFGLLNGLGGALWPGFDANGWWIDLRALPDWAADGVLLVVSALLAAWAIRPAMGPHRRCLTQGAAGLVLLVATLNALNVWRLAAVGAIDTPLPVPLSAGIAAAAWLILRSARRTAAAPPSRSPWGAVAVAAIGGVAMPMAQFFLFGRTDYRRPADAVVVFGARAYANGKCSDALADRVRTACELYHAGLARELVLSGGPGDGAVSEPRAMRRLAVRLGVPPEAIRLDESGLNTRATVANTADDFRRRAPRRVLAVSHFYHLPRVKMAYQRHGVEVYTVPARQTHVLRQTPWLLAREVAAFWVYYLRPPDAVETSRRVSLPGVGTDRPVAAYQRIHRSS